MKQKKQKWIVFYSDTGEKCELFGTWEDVAAEVLNGMDVCIMSPKEWKECSPDEVQD